MGMTGARDERRLFPVGCKPLFGQALPRSIGFVLPAWFHWNYYGTWGLGGVGTPVPRLWLACLGRGGCINDISQAQLDFHRLLHFPHVCSRQPSNAVQQTRFTYCRQLVCHGLMLLAAHQDQGFAGVQATNMTGEGDDLHAIQILVGSVIAEDNRWALFTNLATDRRVKVHPPDFTADHR